VRETRTLRYGGPSRRDLRLRSQSDQTTDGEHEIGAVHCIEVHCIEMQILDAVVDQVDHLLGAGGGNEVAQVEVGRARF